MFRGVRKWSVVAWVAGVAGVALAGAWVLAVLAWADRAGRSGEAAVVVVEPGRALEGVARDLEALAVIDDAMRFRWLARLRNAASAIRAGEYRFAPGATPAQVLEQLVAGEVVVHRLLIVEGSTVRNLLDLVVGAPGLVEVLGPVTPEDLLARLGTGEGHSEGWFFPDTYHYVRGDTDADVLLRAHHRMRAVLGKSGRGGMPTCPIGTSAMRW